MPVHNLPEVPAFREEPASSAISEIALRVVVERPDWKFDVGGTAVLICGHLAITARHVLDDIILRYGTNKKTHDGFEVNDWELKLVQVLPEPAYRIWQVFKAWTCGTDIAVLHLALDRTSRPGEQIIGKQPWLRALPPAAGEHVVMFGYRKSEISVTEKGDGAHHIELNDRPTTSIGIVRQVYPNGRDSVMLPFPCFEIEARADPGMSGGMVIDEEGRLCGVICAGLQQLDSDTPPISYAASLWPMFHTMMSGGRRDRYPPAVSYPLINLAIDGIVKVVDLPDLPRLYSAGMPLGRTL